MQGEVFENVSSEGPEVIWPPATGEGRLTHTLRSQEFSRNRWLASLEAAPSTAVSGGQLFQIYVWRINDQCGKIAAKYIFQTRIINVFRI